MPLHIPVVTSFKEGKRIGAAYNRDCDRLDDNQWIILTDYDVMIMNPYWQEICEEAILKYGHVCGLFSCYTNRIGCKLQVAPGVCKENIENHDILFHRKRAKELYDKNQGRVIDVTENTQEFSGFFMLTSKKVWKEVGGFSTESFFHIDRDYCRKVRKHGYRTMIIPSLYCYHSYLREVMLPYFKTNAP